MKRKAEDLGEVKNKKRVFKPLQMADKIHQLSNENFAVESKYKILWAVGMFNDWTIARMSQLLVEHQIRNCDMSCVQYFSKEDLCFALVRFIREVKKVA